MPSKYCLLLLVINVSLSCYAGLGSDNGILFTTIIINSHHSQWLKRADPSLCFIEFCSVVVHTIFCL